MVSPGRRAALQRALQLVSVVLAAPLAATEAKSCGDPASEPLRDSLHYAAATAPEKACVTCSFFTADSGGSCGVCTIMGGPVDKGSHCDSWSAKG